MTYAQNAAHRVSHPLSPVYDHNARILILGTMPSPQSRARGFYYMHPQNRFWKVLSLLFSEEIPPTPEEKSAFIRRKGIAMWDVLQSCEIKRADDLSIRNPVANDLTPLFKTAKLRAVFTTGRKATALYEKYSLEKTAMPAIYLPSTSPANCRLSLDELVKRYEVILRYLS